MEAGTQVEYRTYDSKGKEHWKRGVIHGVRSYEDPATNIIKRVTYLVDTGNNTRVDKYPFDVRNREMDKRMAKLRAKGATDDEAFAEVLKHTDLPKSKMDVEEVRQPEQIELPAEHIRTL